MISSTLVDSKPLPFPGVGEIRMYLVKHSAFVYTLDCHRWELQNGEWIRREGVSEHISQPASPEEALKLVNDAIERMYPRVAKMYGIAKG